MLPRRRGQAWPGERGDEFPLRPLASMVPDGTVQASKPLETAENEEHPASENRAGLTWAPVSRPDGEGAEGRCDVDPGHMAGPV